MKILIDMNLSPSWREELQLGGHEAIHWSQVGSPSAPDELVIEWAREQGHILLTQDLDFGAILYATGSRGPSVIQLRSDSVNPKIVGAAVRVALQTVQQSIPTGVLVTIDAARHRLTLLPLGNPEK